MRFHYRICTVLFAMVPMGVAAFAQGGGRGAAGATHDFYRFD